MSLLRSPSGLPFKRSNQEEDQSDEIEETDEDDVFQIPPKKPPPESLHKWRQATLVLNASRRFRYTLDLKRQKEAQDRVNKLKASTQAILAVRRFQEASKGAVSDQPPPEGYGLHPRRLAHLIEARDVNELQALGGVGGLAKALHTNLEKGTDGDLEDIQKRKEAYGENRYSTTPPKGFLVFVWEAFQDTTLIILMVCAVLSIVLEMSTSNDRKSAWYDGASIGFAVILVVLVTALSDYKQALQFRGLSEEKRNIQLQVLRDGRRFPISIFEIVVGDVVPLNIGDQVPADGVFISGHSLQIDESSMTGESQPVHVDEKHPFLISGCKVVDGYATMLVTSVGMNTEWGQVMATLEDDTGEETPLQVRLNGAATFIGKVGLTVAALVFIMLIIRYFVDEFRHGDKRAKVVLKRLVQILSVAVTIVVVAVPEGLPLAVTLTLAYSMRKMMADKSLVRHLAACETMGSATTICSDKTGTLTMNQMVVTKTWVAGSFREPGAIKSECQRACEILIDGIAQNCSGSVFIPKGGGVPEVSGSPTEKAILQWGLEIGMDFENCRLVSTVLKVETFNSSKKRAGVMIKKANEIYVHWKGASEMVLELCSKWLDSKGDEIEITEEKLLELKGAIEEMATASLRCVALAYRRADNDEVPGEEGRIPEDRLVLLGIVGIKDPCRPGVRDAVAICQKAGVKVRMVTGDNGLTARAIAEECGILTPGGLVVEGPEFRNYGDEERKQQLPKIDVMARSSPMDKLLLVKTLKEMGEVVAVTGDGTNDAPALHEADIGLSMGISGTEVAKESSDIIILDDNFASVVKVVRWGRSVYANIQKFIQFQLTVNVVALVINFVAAAKSADVPLNAVQLLWVNLIMDTLGALALATEPPTDELMDKRPVGRRDPLITNVMWRNIMIQAAYQLAVELTLYLGGESILKLSGTAAERKTLLNTIIFNSFVFCQLFNEINARKPDKLNVFTGIFRNKLFCGVIALTTVFQVIIVEFLKNFFKTTRLSWKYWILCIVIGAIGLLVGVVSKLIPVPEKPFFTRTRKHRPRRRGSLSEHRGSLSEHKGDKEKIYLGPPQERPLNGDACDNV